MPYNEGKGPATEYQRRLGGERKATQGQATAESERMDGEDNREEEHKVRRRGHALRPKGKAGVAQRDGGAAIGQKPRGLLLWDR